MVIEPRSHVALMREPRVFVAGRYFEWIACMDWIRVWLDVLLEIEQRAKVRVIVAQVRREAVDANVFGSVRASDRDELPLFRMHQERLFKCARA
jgi:hypothetical protein